MKILFLKPINKVYYVIQPNLGLGYLASVAIDEGCDVHILDSGKENLNWKSFEERITKEKYDIVAIQVYAQEVQSAKKHIEIIKAVNPECTIMVGGPQISSAPVETMKVLDKADFGVCGEGEISLKRFIGLNKNDYSNPDLLKDIPNLVWRENNEVKVNRREFLENLDEVKFPAWHLIDPNTYPLSPQGIFSKNKIIAPIIISRGCPYKCSYCSGRNVMGSTTRYRSVDNVIQEIMMLYNEFGVKEFHIADDNFTAQKSFVLNFCNEIISKNLDLAFSLPNGLRLNTLDEEVLKIMEKAGFYSFGVGIESGSDRILKMMKKGLTTELIKQKIELIKKHSNIHVTGFFILGYIDETEEEILKTIEFSKSLKIDKAHFLPLMPLPGTEIWEIYEKALNISYDNIFFYKITTTLSQVSTQKLEKLLKKAVYEFYLRPRIILSLISEIKTLSQLKAIFKRTFDIFFPKRVES